MTTPLHQLQQQAGADFLAFGQPESDAPQLVESFGNFPAEYAAIRQRVAVMHMPQRGLVRVAGGDRADFLHRMITNDVNALQPGHGTHAFMLNEKGRIVADLITLQADDHALLELDRLDTANLIELLDGRLFTEDVQLHEHSDAFEHIALLGPAAAQLLQQAFNADATGLAPLQHRPLQLDHAPVTVYRRDEVGTLGLHLLIACEHAAAIYQQLLDAAGFDPAREAEPDSDYARDRRQTLRGRPVGWLAYNTARIEAGTPLFHIDFGTDSLPAETALLDETVSFTKGCYVGQEIVARMHNLGHPKRVLVGLAIDSDALPVAGSQVFDPPDSDHAHATLGGEIVGGITSSTLSPMRGNNAIAFAVMKWSKHHPGQQVRVMAEDQHTDATVTGLNFL